MKGWEQNSFVIIIAKDPKKEDMGECSPGNHHPDPISSLEFKPRGSLNDQAGHLGGQHRSFLDEGATLAHEAASNAVQYFRSPDDGDG